MSPETHHNTELVFRRRRPVQIDAGVRRKACVLLRGLTIHATLRQTFEKRQIKLIFMPPHNGCARPPRRSAPHSMRPGENTAKWFLHRTGEAVAYKYACSIRNSHISRQATTSIFIYQICTDAKTGNEDLNVYTESVVGGGASE